MSQHIRILIVENDCIKLLTLMLWLDQFPEFAVLGSTLDSGSLGQRIHDAEPDVVLVGSDVNHTTDTSLTGSINPLMPPPAVLSLVHALPGGFLTAQVSESNIKVDAEISLSDLYHTIVSLASHRMVVHANLLQPTALAS